MKIIVNGRNIQLTQAIKDHVNEKLQKVSTHFDFVLEVHIFLSVDKNPRIEKNQHAEATVHMHGAVLRIETASENLYTSIDTLVNKVERALDKQKSKLLHRSKAAHQGETIRKMGDEDDSVATAELDEDDLPSPEDFGYEEEEEGIEVFQTA